LKILNKDEIRDKSQQHLKTYVENCCGHAVNNKYKCFNPSHVDEIPSMVYFEHDNHGNYSPRFKCFGCGEIYDIFSAIQTIEQIDFYEAVVRAAEISNCEVKYEDDGTLLKALKDASDFALSTNNFTPEVFKYLKGKGISVEQAKRYGVGNIISYARYFHHMTSKYDTKMLYKYGLIDDMEGKKYFKISPTSVVFTIKDEKGTPISLAFRRIDKNNPEPKFLNLTNNPYYEKAKTPYMFDDVPDNSNFVYVVEGYSDALSMHVNGIRNSVAITSSNANRTFFETLNKKTNSVVFVLDGDKAGINGTVSMIEDIMPKLDMYSAVIKLPDGTDPDDYIREHGAKAFTELPVMSSAAFWLKHGNYEITQDRLERTIRLMSKIKIKNPEVQCESISNLLKEEGFNANKEDIMKRYRSIKLSDKLPAVLKSLNDMQNEINSIRKEISSMTDEIIDGKEAIRLDTIR